MDVSLEINPSAVLFFAGFRVWHAGRVTFTLKLKFGFFLLKMHGIIDFAFSTNSASTEISLDSGHKRGKECQYQSPHDLQRSGNQFQQSIQDAENRVKNIKLLPGSNSNVKKVAIAQFNIGKGKTRHNSILEKRKVLKKKTNQKWHPE